MSQKTIPQLFEIESLGPNSLIPVDTGVQTFKVRLSNFGRDAIRYANPAPSEVVTNRTVTIADSFRLLYLNPSSAFSITLPSAGAFERSSFSMKDISGALSEFPVSLVPNGEDTIEGLNENYVLRANFGNWKLYSDGSKWTLI